MEAQEFVDQYTEKIKPLFKKAASSWWNAYTTGKKEFFEEYEKINKEMNGLHNNKEEFDKVKRLLKEFTWDHILKRQLEIMHNSYLMSQGNLELVNSIISKEIEIEQKFNTFRAEVGNKQLTDNEIRKILGSETSSEKVKQAWEASKKQGEVVEKDVIEVVKLRNKLAKSLGFDNYYVMSLEAAEQNKDELGQLFEELEESTKDIFSDLKKKVDDFLSNKFGILIGELKPWHYQDLFFQDAPEIYGLNLDGFYSKDILRSAKYFYKDIGIDVGGILERSDLYEKEGKSQHAFAIDLDREGDTRVLENIKNNRYWMETTLHELGHSIYWEFIDPKLPFLLKDCAHTFTTEAIAMLFERQSKNSSFVKNYSEKGSEVDFEFSERLWKTLRLSQLVSCRWIQVMVNFERSLYENPDQDLNKLWWNLVKRFQLINFYRDKPDWASKFHLASAPVYYHNYMLGELFASQLHSQIVKKILKKDSLKNVDYSGNKEIGNYLKESVFSHGMVYHWDELIEKATGERLSSKYFVEEFASS